MIMIGILLSVYSTGDLHREMKIETWGATWGVTRKYDGVLSGVESGASQLFGHRETSYLYYL
jgi:hypothetical protein